MKSILNSISKIPDSRIAFITKNLNYTYANIRQLYENNIEVIRKLKKSSVVIRGRKRFEFARLLSILDGNVKRIIFLPEDIESLTNQFYQDTEVNYEVYLENETLCYKFISEPKSNSDSFPCEWVLPTSGTTNISKLVVHTYSSLTHTAQSNIEQGKNFKWGLVFDIYRFSGIQVFLQAIISGSSLIISENKDTLPDILTLFSKNSCNALSATPSFWRRVLMSKELKNLKLKRITLGGEIVDKNILIALKSNFPQAKISHIYASTEVGVGFSVKDGLAGFPASFIDTGVGNVRFKIDKKNILWIHSGQTTQKYIAKDNIYDKDGYVNTGDLVMVNEDRVYFLGRESGTINVGGNKVQPEEIESILLSIESINAVYVYARKNSMMGSLVCADIVISHNNIDKNILKKEIISFCRRELEDFKVPAILNFVKQLATTHSGKLKRN